MTTNQDADPALFIIDLQDANKKKFSQVFMLIPYWRYISMLRIRIRIRIHMFLGLPDPDLLVRGIDPDPALDPDPDPSIIMQKK